LFYVLSSMFTEQTEPTESVLPFIKECNGLGESSLSRSQPSEQSHFIEEMGLVFEQVGMPRMAGRILAWLLIANPPMQSSGALVEVLQASKGSISTITRMLIQIGLIERVALPGDRRDYFQIKPNAWSQMTQQRLTQIAAFREMAERGLGLVEGGPEAQRRLREMRDIHAFWERELPRLHERWEEEQRAREHSQP